MSTEKVPRWLEKDGERHLYAAEDVEAACINGWKEPEGVRGTGEPWNPEPVEGETPQLVHVATMLKANAEAKGKREAKAEKAAVPKEARSPPKETKK